MERKSRLLSVLAGMDRSYDMMKYRLRERMGGRDRLMILPYRGFGTQEVLHLRGRVLEDRGINPAEDDHTLWDNLANMYRRFKSNEIPYARVRAWYGDAEQIVTANVEGFFEVELNPRSPLTEDRLWHEVQLELLHPQRPNEPQATAAGQVLVPLRTAEYGVISDIDDTVLQSDVGSLLRMARALFLSNARMRLPFQGVGAFYRALHAGSSGNAVNPMFYVSSSPWNLYDMLSDFFDLQDIPVGPVLFLRDWGLSEYEIIPTRNREYKLAYIKHIIQTYPNLPFILIGDSSQEDPEIYYDIAKLYPERILSVYIRNVSHHPRRLEEIKQLAQATLAAGSPLLLAETTLPLAQHAAEHRWIHPDALVEIETEKQADEAPPGPIEQLIGQDLPAEGPTVEVAPDADAKETAEAVENGAIESALESTTPSQPAPTVVIEPDEPNEQRPSGAESDA
jgi:phosphatidate phosphatase APP1